MTAIVPLWLMPQHTPAPEQGDFVRLTNEETARLRALMEFTELPSAHHEVRAAAEAVAEAVDHHRSSACRRVVIGGAPFLMCALQTALTERGWEVAYAFSVRESVDVPQTDGSVRKVAVFRHKGWVVFPPIIEARSYCSSCGGKLPAEGDAGCGSCNPYAANY